MKTVLQNSCLFLLLMCVYIWTHAQVVEAPDLHCVSVNSGGNDVLDWSIPTVNCGPFNAYYIYRATDINGPYSIVATISNPNQTSYTDLVGNGGNTVYYYFMVSDFNCPGFTFAHSDTLDNLDPATPEINYVTVNNGIAEIDWQPSPSPETYGYIIYRVIGINNVQLDTIYGQFNTHYIDLSSTPNSNSMSYSVAAIDSCGNTGPLNIVPQHTIYLKDSVVRCEQKIILSWNFYDNWKNGIQKYDVEMSVNGAPFVILQSLPANVLTYTVGGFNDHDSVCFRITAKENLLPVTSVSNELCSIVNVVQPVKEFYIRNVTVGSPNNIWVYFSMNSLSDLSKLTIERGLDTTSFTQLATIQPPYDFSVINVFIDTTALTDVNSYYYRLIATDSCAEKYNSTTGNSILLKGYAFTDLSFYVGWNESIFDSGKVQYYEVYRDDGTGFNLISSELPEVLSYEEKGLPTTTPCYYVNAVDSLIFPNGIADTIHSRSNVVCLNQPSEIYMPNAFAPLGKNNSFRPILNTQGVKSYSFLVFNRWGEQLFSSTNPSDGWDGKYKNVYVQQGAYAYIVNVIDGKGTHVEAKGTVLVIR